MGSLYISAAHKSSGKTTLAVGLCRELSRRRRRVQPFKKGPDYIDPLWLGRAAGRACLNLDFNTMSPEEIRDGFSGYLSAADLGLIEGNVGLFDSVDLRGSQSNAELAKLLDVPLILVLDAQGMSRGVAPLLLGYQAFDPGLTIAGVVFNRVGGARHEANLRRVVEYYTDLPVFGALHRDPSLQIEERHLGLMPSNEAAGADAQIERIRVGVAAQVDIDRLLALADSAPAPRPSATSSPPPAADGPPVRIALARDEAFGFYYTDDLRSLCAAGAELIEFSPTTDPQLPNADGVFIGGGFPECRMRELAANRSMRESVRDYIEMGGVVYAECGGLMYLCRGMRWNDEYGPMCGVLNADVAVHERPQGRGYVRLRETGSFPWPKVAGASAEVRAHEFHHSAIVNPDPGWVYGYEVLRGSGIDGRHDAVVYKNLLAGYAHLRHVGGSSWTERFVAQIRRAAA
jgi:cobyrinic acid a,c-diamide synthase